MNLARRCSQLVAQVRLRRNCRPRRAFEAGHEPACHEGVKSRILRCRHQQADPTSVRPLASNPFAEGWWWTLVREIRLWSTRTAPSTDDVKPPMELQTRIGSFCSMSIFSATQICVSTAGSGSGLNFRLASGCHPAEVASPGLYQSRLDRHAKQLAPSSLQSRLLGTFDDHRTIKLTLPVARWPSAPAACHFTS